MLWLNKKAAYPGWLKWAIYRNWQYLNYNEYNAQWPRNGELAPPARDGRRYVSVAAGGNRYTPSLPFRDGL
jgi:hypothetical protein